MLIAIIDWETEASAARSISEKVFIQEQLVPIADEWDEHDKTATHFVVFDSDNRQNPIACARLLNDGQVGRVAVLKHHRQKGIGEALIRHIIHFATQQDYPTLFLHAQTQTIEFYRKLGFTDYGETFMDAGIPHIAMKR
jgi:predicted GNAT family N-acyltransferase